jgi:hypothetical protein
MAMPASSIVWGLVLVGLVLSKSRAKYLHQIGRISPDALSRPTLHREIFVSLVKQKFWATLLLLNSPLFGDRDLIDRGS